MSYLLKIISLLPVILAALKAVEREIGSGNGKTKKEIVMSCIQAVVLAGESVDNKTVSMISELVDRVVGILNASGLWITSRNREQEPGVVPLRE